MRARRSVSISHLRAIDVTVCARVHKRKTEMINFPPTLLLPSTGRPFEFYLSPSESSSFTACERRSRHRVWWRLPRRRRREGSAGRESGAAQESSLIPDASRRVASELGAAKNAPLAAIKWQRQHPSKDLLLSREGGKGGEEGERCHRRVS